MSNIITQNVAYQCKQQEDYSLHSSWAGAEGACWTWMTELRQVLTWAETRDDTWGITTKSVNIVTWCGWNPWCLDCNAAVIHNQWGFQGSALRSLYMPCFDKQIYSFTRYHSANGGVACAKPRLPEHDKALFMFMIWRQLGTAWCSHASGQAAHQSLVLQWRMHTQWQPKWSWGKTPIQMSFLDTGRYY